MRFPPGDMPALMATASGALFLSENGTSQPDNPERSDIMKQSAVIIGAGISGLYAATLLKKRVLIM
ncbi:NAD(P)/FAD-dependent oxidoreductase [Klebsiella variicola subsp. variicola]|nr:NAD(P)/FAD-dependent oxidoreductase [Klebsiella variicola subsp. variicola]